MSNLYNKLSLSVSDALDTSSCRFSSPDLEEELHAMNQSAEVVYVAPCVGVDPERIVSADNPVDEIRAVIFDFDMPYAKANAITRTKGDKELKLTSQPSIATITKSGGLRLIFMLETPLHITSPYIYTEFWNALCTELELFRVCGGNDRKAANSSMRFDLGRTGGYVDEEGNFPCDSLRNTLHPDVVDRCFLKAVSRAMKTWARDNSSITTITAQEAIPLLNEAFPDVAPFAVGKRCHRFWDPTADNTTAVVMREHGFFCYTGTSSFVPFEEVLGDYQKNTYEQKLALILRTTCYDGEQYYMLDGNSHTWIPNKTTDFQLYAKVTFPFLTQRMPNSRTTYLQSVEAQLRKDCRCTAAYPLIMEKPGLLPWNYPLPSQRILNTFIPRHAEPHEDLAISFYTDAKTCFPTITRILENNFNTEDPNATEEEKTSRIQRLHFLLAWTKLAYEALLHKRKLQMPALFVAGNPGCGKTLFVMRVLGRLLCGGDPADGQKYFVSGDRWTAHLMYSPLIVIDDPVLDDFRSQEGFSERLKQFVASPFMTCEAKFKQPVDLPCYSRLVVSTNCDPESMKILPDLSRANADKVAILKFDGAPLRFVDITTNEVERAINKEIPFFARALLNLEFKNLVVEEDSRFGLKPFVDQQLLGEIRARKHNILRSVLMKTLREYFETHGTEKSLMLDEADLMNRMSGVNQTAMRSVSGPAFGRYMMSHAETKGMTRKIMDDMTVRWTFDKATLFPRGLKEDASIEDTKHDQTGMAVKSSRSMSASSSEYSQPVTNVDDEDDIRPVLSRYESNMRGSK